MAESIGFEVLHLYVDALWLKKKDAASKADFQEVISEISLQTGLGVSLDGIYRWITFLPSRMDARVPVANRYFGVMQDGSMVVRGIEARRRDTPAWVVETQNRMIECLSLAKTVSELPEYVLQAFQVFQTALQEIRSGQVPLQKLVVMSRISHDLESYRSPTPAARAARIMLAETGRRTKPGQKMRFIYMRGEPDVCPWETPGQIDAGKVDHEKYVELLARAAASVLTPFGIAEGKLKHWAHTEAEEPELVFEAGLEYQPSNC